MDFYGIDSSEYDFSFSDSMMIGSLPRASRYLSTTVTFGDDDDIPPPAPKKPASPPRHRHDGTSPLPLGMDWSAPPRKWDGQNSVWPHDPSTGWSYCVTIPSWVILPEPSGSDPVVFYRVEIGIQSPEGITTIRGILRRFGDFLKLFSELKRTFSKKRLPVAPAKKLLRKKSRAVLEERRCGLEDWMEKLLSDIDLSRSAPVAIFLELEAAARSCFYDSNQQNLDANSSAGSISYQFQSSPTVSLMVGNWAIASNYGDDSAYETSELGTPRHGKDGLSEPVKENTASDQEFADPEETTFKDDVPAHSKGRVLGGPFPVTHENVSWHQKHLQNGNSSTERDEVNQNTSDAIFCHEDEKEHFSMPAYRKWGGHHRRLSRESIGSDVSSTKACDRSNLRMEKSHGDNSLDIPEGVGAPSTKDMLADVQFPRDLLVALPLDERSKMNRVLSTIQRRIATAKTDMEDLIARLNQELAVREYLTTKVKDLEVELETNKQSGKENLQQAILIERERFTQTQWDVEDLNTKCVELELKLKSEQDDKLLLEATKTAICHDNEMLLQQLDAAKEQIESLQKQNEELELKSKADVKLLVKEVKTLRSSQAELKQEFSRLMKAKLEVERALQKENERWEQSNSANAKLLHECEILRSRLEECSVNFLTEEEDKLIMDTSSPSDAVDLLLTSDNRIGLLLAEAQLLAQDVEHAIRAATVIESGGKDRPKDEELRKMLTDIFIDNAKLRKQVNSVIRCALVNYEKSEEEDDKEEAPSRKTVLSKFLER